MNTLIKEFKKLITNNMPTIYNEKRSNDFVTHQELSLVYFDIKNDIKGLDQKFSVKFADADIKSANIRKDIILLDDKLTGEIGNAREDAHRDLMEVKNEIIARMCVSEGNIMSLQDSVATLKTDVSEIKTDVSEIKTDVVMIKNYLFTELTPRVEVIEGDLFAIKDYLFTKLTSDIRTVVKECIAEQFATS